MTRTSAAGHGSGVRHGHSLRPRGRLGRECRGGSSPHAGGRRPGRDQSSSSSWCMAPSSPARTRDGRQILDRKSVRRGGVPASLVNTSPWTPPPYVSRCCRSNCWTRWGSGTSRSPARDFGYGFDETLPDTSTATRSTRTESDRTASHRSPMHSPHRSPFRRRGRPVLDTARAPQGAAARFSGSIVIVGWSPAFRRFVGSCTPSTGLLRRAGL